MDLKSIIIVNSSSGHFSDFEKFIQPYLDLWGVTYETLDIGKSFDTNALTNCSLVILGHQKVGLSLNQVNSMFNKLEENNIGLVNFDREIIKFFLKYSHNENNTKSITIIDDNHYITRNHYVGEKFILNRLSNQSKQLKIEKFERHNPDIQVLLNADEGPFVLTTNKTFKIVHWVSYEWVSHFVLGPLSGLDNILLRSIIWASKKPFVLKSIPPYATLRIDDCVGDSECYKEKPFEWVAICNKYNFKPWLGIFYDALSEQSIHKLREIAEQKQGSISIHGEELYGKYFKDKDADSKDKIKQKILGFSGKNRIKLSNYVIPHAYDITSESLQALKEIGIDNIGIAYPPDTGGGVFEPDNQWIAGSAFRKFEKGTDNVPWDGESFHLPVFYNDFIEINNNEKIFNCLSEIRDVNGYEWFNYTQSTDQILDVNNAIKMGTKIFARCFQSRILGNLFTHEDSWRGKFIALIPPEKWEKMIAGIYSNILRYKPRFDFIENAVNTVRELKLSRIYYIKYNENSGFFSIWKNTEKISDIQVYYNLMNNDDIILEQQVALSDNKGIDKQEINFVPEWPNQESLFKEEFPIENIKKNELHYGLSFRLHCDGSIVGIKVYKSTNETCTYEILLADSDMKPVFELTEVEVNNNETGWQTIKVKPLQVKKASYFLLIKGIDCCVPNAPYGFCLPVNKCFISASENSGVIYNKQTNEIKQTSDNYLRDIIFKPNETFMLKNKK